VRSKKITQELEQEGRVKIIHKDPNIVQKYLTKLRQQIITNEQKSSPKGLLELLWMTLKK